MEEEGNWKNNFPSQFMYFIFRGRGWGREFRWVFRIFFPLPDGNYGHDENHDGLI